ncbi:hypothetical protein [Novosphingobium sp. 9]|uniref:hypothetical protein n=1 Tax=Novosphingobium sp. 9 TaxID=2025349 RepID=UPI0021B6A3FF|nr:hypothetical protein [Novosphingobium sp. 9]
MTDENPAHEPLSRSTRVPESREDRLAAKLRENLRRRKVQARALQVEPASGDASGATQGAEQSESGALSKPVV